MITWLNIIGGIMILWFPITGLICVTKEDDLGAGLKCFFSLLGVILALGAYFLLAGWLLLHR